MTNENSKQIDMLKIDLAKLVRLKHTNCKIYKYNCIICEGYEKDLGICWINKAKENTINNIKSLIN